MTVTKIFLFGSQRVNWLILSKPCNCRQNGNVDPVEVNDWFHGDITKEEAANKLAQGSFCSSMTVR